MDLYIWYKILAVVMSFCRNARPFDRRRTDRQIERCRQQDRFIVRRHSQSQARGKNDTFSRSIIIFSFNFDDLCQNFTPHHHTSDTARSVSINPCE